MNKHSWSMKANTSTVTARLVGNQLLRTLQGALPRHPKQINKFLEYDAVVLRDLPKPHGFTVLKTEAILEEIRSGLYKDPFTIGWMSVTTTISNIAAVGASPDGILLQLQVPKNADPEFLRRIFDGVNAACTEYGVYVLGGDTKFSNEICVGSTCIGHFEGIWPLSRIGCKTGDLIYTTGKPGAGSLYAFSTLFQGKNIRFRPVARVKESRVISKFATSCIDSSNGFIPALASLAELNSVGFSLDIPVEDTITEEALAACEHFALPCWLMLAGPHGDYELIFTIPPERQLNFLTAAADSGWAPTYVGTLDPSPGLNILYQGINLQTDPTTVANLFTQAEGNIQVYLQSLLQHHRSLI